MGNMMHCNSQDHCGEKDMQFKRREDFQTALLRAVGDRDIAFVQRLAENPAASHHLPQLSSAILDRAVMHLLSQTSDIDLAILELLLRYGAQDVSKDILYSVISLLCLANLELTTKVTHLIVHNTQSRIITSTLLKSLVDCKQLTLLQTMVTSDAVDLDSYWNDPFYLKDHRLCGTSLDSFTHNRLLSPPIAQLFINYAKKESTLRRTFENILQYERCGCEVEERTVRRLVKQLCRVGFKFTSTDIKHVSEHYPRIGDWLKQNMAQVQPSKAVLKKCVRQVMTNNVLQSVVKMHTLPNCVKDFLLFNETNL